MYICIYVYAYTGLRVRGRANGLLGTIVEDKQGGWKVGMYTFIHVYMCVGIHVCRYIYIYMVCVRARVRARF